MMIDARLPSALLPLRAMYIQACRLARVLRRGWNPAFGGDGHLQGTMAQLVHTHAITRVVETGTFMGSTALGFRALLPEVSEVHTAERSLVYHCIARLRLRGAAGVFPHRGSSPEVLRRLLASLDPRPRTLFFLDAHWDEYNPLLDELSAIAASGWKPAVAIHDFLVPGHPELGYDSYPRQGIVYDLNYVLAHVQRIYGSEGYECFYNQAAEGDKRGCVFFIPRGWLPPSVDVL